MTGPIAVLIVLGVAIFWKIDQLIHEVRGQRQLFTDIRDQISGLRHEERKSREKAP